MRVIIGARGWLIGWSLVMTALITFIGIGVYQAKTRPVQKVSGQACLYKTSATLLNHFHADPVYCDSNLQMNTKVLDNEDVLVTCTCKDK